MKFIRPEIIELINNINGSFTYSGFNQMNVNKSSIFDFFDYGGDIYKEKFISHFKGIQHKDDYFFYSEEFDKFRPKVGGVFKNRNTFNVFYIMYKNAKSLNKYGIKKYLFKEYIESDFLSDSKIDKLKIAVTEFYTNEEDLNNFIYGNKKFIYKNYSDEELEVLYDMGCFIKEDDIEDELFNGYEGITLIDLILSYSGRKERVSKGDIFANDKVYNYFLYFYNNSNSFRKIYTRKQLIKDFLEKDKIGLNSAIKYIGLLIEYVKSLDEIITTPYCDLLDDLKELNIKCIEEKEKVYQNEDDFIDGIKGEEFDKNADVIYSDFELDFLSIFYDTDKILGYTYYDNNEFIDSEYLEIEEEAPKKGIGISHRDYNRFLKR